MRQRFDIINLCASLPSGSNRLISRRGALSFEAGLLILCLLSLAINVGLGIELTKARHKIVSLNQDLETVHGILADSILSRSTDGTR